MPFVTLCFILKIEGFKKNRRVGGKVFKFLRKLLGIEENKYEPRILAGKYKPRIYNPDAYKVDDDFSLYYDHDFALDPEYSSLSCNVCHHDD